jgi:hypothetical protein
MRLRRVHRITFLIAMLLIATLAAPRVAHTHDHAPPGRNM